MTLGGEVHRAVVEVLHEAQRRGFVGPGPVEREVDRSIAFASLQTGSPERALDLGSGGGLPGLVLAFVWPDTAWTLLDANTKRTSFLAEAVTNLGLAPRVAVVCARAEEAGRTKIRSSYDLVVARSFGTPAVVAECAAPLLRVGGRLIVAEPPGGAPERWRAEGLALVGMTRERAVTEPVALQALLQDQHCPIRFPRRTGIPTKRPLF